MRQCLSDVGRRSLKILAVFAVILATTVGAAVWWVGAFEPTKTFRLHDTFGRSEQEQLQKLIAFSEEVPCEHIGKLIERDGKVSLEFRINTDAGYDQLRCIEAGAPEGFVFAEVAD